MDSNASKQLLDCINGALLCPRSLTIPAQQKDLTDCTEAIVCHVMYDPNGQAYSLEIIRDNCRILATQVIEAFKICANPEIFDRLVEKLLSLKVHNEYACRSIFVNMLCEAARNSKSSAHRRWAISLIRRHCHLLVSPNHRLEDIPIRNTLFSLCYDVYMHDTSSDIKLLRLLEATLYELHVSVADWKAKAATDKSYVIRKCINDCEEILNMVVDTPSHFALHAQRFQELIPYNWVVHMPSLLISICLYCKLYPEKLYPFIDHLKKDGIIIEPPNAIFSKQMNTLLSVPETSMMAIECACFEIESAIVHQKDDISIEADAFATVDGLEELYGFDDNVNEVQTMDAISQELCLLVASAPPSQVAKISWVTIAALNLLVSWSHSREMGDIGGYRSSIVLAMVSKITDLLKDLVFTLPCHYEMDDALLRPMIATVSAYTVALRSSAFQVHTHEDNFHQLKMDIEKVWRNHRNQRRAFLVTHSKHDLRNEDNCSRSIYGVLLVMTQSVPYQS
ncbi:hypothetical protein K450DRAFT_234722 [Umbelopsis ramanniana AG]|uniref:Uncharacterized protein n=1 Tax=Umbelopsis ramanniana AG TaxID=1314678 RepID=A0AAD5EDC4_UMBRA|nr:uncharacterized protein K450DRAFT_234722 [Umbelopsis ramanniana AG]KAI8581119.1 hypothetical protein K450DRAFT_234722 [Umbelopsis ramanniana AG]